MNYESGKMASMLEEIKKALIEKQVNAIDRIIHISKIVELENNSGLAEALGISEIIISDWSNAFNEHTKAIPDMALFETKKPPEADDYNIKNYINEFYGMYKEIKGHKFLFTKKEIGQMNNIKKTLKSLVVFQRICQACREANDKIKGGQKIDNNWKFILSNLSPSIIMNKINFIMAEEAKEWERGPEANRKFGWRDEHGKK